MRDSIDGRLLAEEKGIEYFWFPENKKNMTDAKLMSEMD
jgi:hypothetical protein